MACCMVQPRRHEASSDQQRQTEAWSWRPLAPPMKQCVMMSSSHDERHEGQSLSAGHIHTAKIVCGMCNRRGVCGVCSSGARCTVPPSAEALRLGQLLAERVDSVTSQTAWNRAVCCRSVAWASPYRRRRPHAMHSIASTTLPPQTVPALLHKQLCCNNIVVVPGLVSTVGRLSSDGQNSSGCRQTSRCL